MAVIAIAGPPVPTDLGIKDQHIAEQPTSPMPTIRGLPRPTLLLPLVERVGEPGRSTASLIREAVEGFLDEQGRPPDIVLLSTLRWLSVCSQAGGYTTATREGEACVYIGYLEDVGDNEARCAFVMRAETST